MGSLASSGVFYEEYTMVDDSTMRRRTATDSTFRSFSDSARFEYRGGTLGRGPQTVVTRFAGDSVQWGGGASTLYLRISNEVWRAVFPPRPPAAERPYYELRRIPGAASTSPALAASSREAHATIEGLMQELYASVTREPGKPFAWERLRRITLPYTVMLPQARQTGGQLTPSGVDQFISNIDAGWKPVIGTPRDRGFYERQTNLVVHQYGDVAIAFTTYEKGAWEPRSIQSRGINAVHLVRREGLWYIVSMGWDEENTAGPLPPDYRGR